MRATPRRCLAHGGSRPCDVDWVCSSLLSPGTMHYENGIKQTLFMTASPSISTPEGTEQSYFTFVLWRNDDVSKLGVTS